jgi:NADPH:quinone reductase
MLNDIARSHRIGTSPGDRSKPHMRAMVISSFGSPDVLELSYVPAPVPQAGEIRVAVHAAGVNPVDVGNRADGTWAGLELPAILGSDFSGVVDLVGAGVGEWRPGDEVMGVATFRGSADGTYAEFHVAAAETVVRKPAHLTHIEAGAVPLAGGTALSILRRLAPDPGGVVLVHGAGGGVGTFAVQFLAAAGARVVALASRQHHELLIDLGVEAAIDYRRADALALALERAGEPFAGIVDLVGGNAVARSLSLVRCGGRAATIAALKGDLDLAIDKNITIHGVLLDRADRSLLLELGEALESGRLRPVVTEVYALEDAAAAHRRLEAGHVQGKIVLAVQ